MMGARGQAKENGHCMINLCVFQGVNGRRMGGPMGVREGRMLGGQTIYRYSSATVVSLSLFVPSELYIHTFNTPLLKTGRSERKVLFAIEYQRCHFFLISFHFTIIKSQQCHRSVLNPS